MANSIQTIKNKLSLMFSKTGLFAIQKEEFKGLLSDMIDKLQEVNDNSNQVAKSLIWQSPVATFSALTTAYPAPQSGWAAMVSDEGIIYSYNGLEWKSTGLKAFPTDVALSRNVVAASPGKNLYNPANKMVDTYLYYDYGDYGSGANTNYFCSDYIPIDQKGLVVNVSIANTSSFINHIYYDNKKNAVGATRSNIVPLVANAAFVRFVFKSSDIMADIQVEKGNTVTEYEPYSPIGGYVNQNNDKIEVNLPDRIYAITGDTLQLFIRGMVKAVNPYIYDVVVNCSKGRMYPRYFEYTPKSGDIGTTTLQVKLKDNSGTVLASKSCQLITKSAVKAPVSSKKVLVIGDSLTNARIYPVEAFRRLTQTEGSPAGLGYSNISFVGRKKTDYGIGIEGNSGWSWVDYLTKGRKAFSFTITAPTTMPTIEAIYKDSNNKTYTMWWDYSSTSVKMIVDDMVSTPPTSGKLTKVSGTGDATITYSSVVESSGNPFWNDATNSLDVRSYVNKWCGGSIDVVYVLLTWNAQYGNRTDFSTFTDYARTLFNHIKSMYPNVKIKLLGVQLPDQRQGMGLLGAPQENTYTDQYGLTVTAFNMNNAYQDLANETEFSNYVEFVNVSSQFDSEYNMPYVSKAVNVRNSTTESVGTNDVHPDENGYKQIADVVYRNFVANYCQ